jgi:hypothetical protein
MLLNDVLDDMIMLSILICYAPADVPSDQSAELMQQLAVGTRLNVVIGQQIEFEDAEVA